MAIMIPLRLTRRAVLHALATAAAAACATSVIAQENKPATGDSGSTPSKADRIRELEEYYAKLYAQPLQSQERLPREIAVVSLSRIDAPATTAALFGVLKGPTKESAVAYLAWEALHARRASLTTEQHREWALAGARVAGAGAFPGSTAAPMLRALAGQPPSTFDPAHAKLALRVAGENDLENEHGADALSALRDWVAAWREPAIVKALLTVIGKPAFTPAWIMPCVRCLPLRPRRMIRGSWPGRGTRG
jgi:hypothetical protein